MAYLHHFVARARTGFTKMLSTLQMALNRSARALEIAEQTITELRNALGNSDLPEGNFIETNQDLQDKLALYAEDCLEKQEVKFGLCLAFRRDF